MGGGGERRRWVRRRQAASRRTCVRGVGERAQARQQDGRSGHDETGGWNVLQSATGRERAVVIRGIEAHLSA